jgi:hypothetical protein
MKFYRTIKFYFDVLMGKVTNIKFTHMFFGFMLASDFGSLQCI